MFTASNFNLALPGWSRGFYVKCILWAGSEGQREMMVNGKSNDNMVASNEHHMIVKSTFSYRLNVSAASRV